MMEKVRECWEILGIMGKYWEMLGNVGQCCQCFGILGNVGQCWVVLGDVGCCWVFLGDVVVFCASKRWYMLYDVCGCVLMYADVC